MRALSQRAMRFGAVLLLSAVSASVDVRTLTKGAVTLSEAEALLVGIESRFADDATFQSAVRATAISIAEDPAVTTETPLHVLLRIHADHDVSTASVRAWEAQVATLADATLPSALALGVEERRILADAGKPFSFGDYLRSHPERNPASNPHVHHFLAPTTPRHLAALAQLPQVEAFLPLPSTLKIAPELWTQMQQQEPATFAASTPPPTYVDVLVGITDRHLDTLDEAALLAGVVQSAINALPSVIAARSARASAPVAAEVPLPFSSHHAADRLAISNISRALLNDVVRAVASHAEISWVEERPTYIAFNRFAHALQQSGAASMTTAAGTAGALGDTPLWDAGLHGEGEVVGIGDSGLDHDSCYFYDPANPLTITPNQINNFPAHNKVAQYVPFASTGEDEDGGHGTHVAGSVAGRGSGECRTIQDDGMAYNAKIAFFDIGQPNAQSLNVPASLRESMFPPSYDVGARIHTNSWGANTNRYTLNSRDVDA